ncbi:MAG: phosphatidate cytidylyltransferase [Gammaproteobacteria bacterium]|nr:phosphatidate cytidylyltransferase [Gammaproteobacteria bacterium]
MLKQRVITAIVLAVIFLVALFGFGKTLFAAFLIVIAGLCAWEWAAIGGLRDDPRRYAYVSGNMLLILVLQMLFADPGSLRFLLLFAMIWWLVVCLMLYLQPVENRSASGFSGFYLLAGPLTVVPALMSAQYLRDSMSPWLLLYALAVVWAMDIGAYFTGKRWGKNKLAPLISPGKTIEGVLGGVVAAIVLCLLALLLRDDSTPRAFTLLLATIIAGGISVVGDLFESRGKRMAGMKDSGTLLPGHGGILDRLDSAFAALPLFAFVLLWI